MLGGDIFEDDQRVVVRLEVPGMEKKNFNNAVIDDMLVARGRSVLKANRAKGVTTYCDGPRSARGYQGSRIIAATSDSYRTQLLGLV